MSDIPTNILKVARECWRAMGFANDRIGQSDHIAIAILAERERCANTAYRICAETRHVTLGVEVRAAIMKGPKL